jgi:hypothetical protein
MPEGNKSTQSFLFMALVGAKAVWLREGAEGAASAFAHFSSFTESALAEWNYEGVKGAAVESDSAAVLCESAVVAVQIGSARHLGSGYALDRSDRRPPVRPGAARCAKPQDHLPTQRSLKGHR